jgi:glycosyltransferase involved in cell wall biosynthesis
MQPRVLHLMAGSAQGGAEAFCLRLLPALARRGAAQALVTRPHMPNLPTLQSAGVQVHTARFGTPWLDWQTRGVIKKSVRAFQPDIIMTWMNRAAAFSKCITPHGAKIVGRLGGYYDLKYYRHCDALVGNTLDLVDYFVREGWPREQCAYLPNFADTANTPPVSRQALGVPDGAPLLLALGRFHANKAFDTLLRALAQVPNAHLILAGDGDLKPDLFALAAQCGVAPRVHFLGWRDDTAALYAAADIFVCPSRHEPLGNVILEAMAAGKPIVSTNNHGAMQLLQDGQNGVMVPVDDAFALARAVNDLIVNTGRAAALGNAARQAYDASYSEDSVCAHYLDFFRQMAGA